MVCWVAGGLGHARHYMPSKISSSCLGPTGHSGVFVCVSVQVSRVRVHRVLRAAQLGTTCFEIVFVTFELNWGVNNAE